MIIQAIVSQEKPASQPFLDLVAAIRQRRLSALGQKCMNVLQQNFVQCDAGSIASSNRRREH